MSCLLWAPLLRGGGGWGGRGWAPAAPAPGAAALGLRRRRLLRGGCLACGAGLGACPQNAPVSRAEALSVRTSRKPPPGFLFGLRAGVGRGHVEPSPLPPGAQPPSPVSTRTRRSLGGPSGSPSIAAPGQCPGEGLQGVRAPEGWMLQAVGAVTGAHEAVLGGRSLGLPQDDRWLRSYPETPAHPARPDSYACWEEAAGRQASATSEWRRASRGKPAAAGP